MLASDRLATDRRLPFGLAAYLVLLPVQLPLPVLARLAPSDLCLVLVLVASAGRVSVRRGMVSGWHVFLVVLFSVSLLYSALAHNLVTFYGVANKYVGFLFLLAGFVVVAWQATDPPAARKMLSLFLKGVVMSTGVTLSLYVIGTVSGLAHPPYSFGGRFVAFLVDPNAQGGLLAVSLILHLATRDRQVSLLRGRWATAGTVVLPLALVATGSRSAWIGVGIGFVIILISRPAHAARGLALAVVPVVISATVFGVGVSMLSGDSLNRGNTIDQRIVIIDVALADWRAEPIMGGGLGTYYARHGEIVHNTPVWFLADLGVVGLATFLGLSAWVVGRALAARRLFSDIDDRSLVLGLFIAHLAMCGLSLGIEAFYQRHWWLAMAMLAGIATPLATGRAGPNEASSLAEG